MRCKNKWSSRPQGKGKEKICPRLLDTNLRNLPVDFGYQVMLQYYSSDDLKECICGLKPN
jgi:hypothetical protein